MLIWPVSKLKRSVRGLMAHISLHDLMFNAPNHVQYIPSSYDLGWIRIHTSRSFRIFEICFQCQRKCMVGKSVNFVIYNTYGTKKKRRYFLTCKGCSRNLGKKCKLSQPSKIMIYFCYTHRPKVLNSLPNYKFYDKNMYYYCVISVQCLCELKHVHGI